MQVQGRVSAQLFTFFQYFPAFFQHFSNAINDALATRSTLAGAISSTWTCIRRSRRADKPAVDGLVILDRSVGNIVRNPRDLVPIIKRVNVEQNCCMNQPEHIYFDSWHFTIKIMNGRYLSHWSFRRRNIIMADVQIKQWTNEIRRDAYSLNMILILGLKSYSCQRLPWRDDAATTINNRKKKKKLYHQTPIAALTVDENTTVVPEVWCPLHNERLLNSVHSSNEMNRRTCSQLLHR